MVQVISVIYLRNPFWIQSQGVFHSKNQNLIFTGTKQVQPAGNRTVTTMWRWRMQTWWVTVDLQVQITVCGFSRTVHTFWRLLPVAFQVNKRGLDDPSKRSEGEGGKAWVLLKNTRLLSSRSQADLAMVIQHSGAGGRLGDRAWPYLKEGKKKEKGKNENYHHITIQM